MKKILITMLETGFGHKSPAIAVKESLSELSEEPIQIDIVDFAKESGAYRDDLAIKGSWDLALAFPVTARIGYLLVELSGKNTTYIDILFKDFVLKGIDYIDSYKPDMVFATHALALYTAVKAKELLNHPFKVVAYVVDPFDGYAWWANEGADALLVASQESKDRLLSHGVKPQIIHQMGFPIKKSFFNIQDPCTRLIESLDLDPRRPSFLVTAGGQGIGRTYFFAELLYLSQLPINLIVVAGKSKGTQKRFDTLKKIVQSRTKLVSLGYVTNMNELMCASDAIIGKAGASTAMEAFFLGKPFIFTDWATYNDRYIIQFALKSKVGWYRSTAVSFVNLVKKLASGGELEAYKENLRHLALEPGTDDVAGFLLRMLDIKTVPRSS